MKKKALLIVFSALAISLASFAGTPENMQVWLKNGEYSVFDISQVDSVTFGVVQQEEPPQLTENTMPPTFAAPLRSAATHFKSSPQDTRILHERLQPPSRFETTFRHTLSTLLPIPQQTVLRQLLAFTRR